MPLSVRDAHLVHLLAPCGLLRRQPARLCGHAHDGVVLVDEAIEGRSARAGGAGTRQHDGILAAGAHDRVEASSRPFHLRLAHVLYGVRTREVPRRRLGAPSQTARTGDWHGATGPAVAATATREDAAAGKLGAGRVVVAVLIGLAARARGTRSRC